MKKWLVVLLSVLLLALLNTACSSLKVENQGETDDNGENAVEEQQTLSGDIKIWAHPIVGQDKAADWTAMWQDMIASFNESYPDVNVIFEEVPWANIDQKILTAMASNTGPDVFYLIPDKLPQYAAQGFLTSLEGKVDERDLNDFTESSLYAARYKSDMFGLPILQSALAFYYNVDLIKEIGEDPAQLPTTWAEFDEWAVKAKEKGIYARNFQGGSTLNGSFYPLLWQNGGDVVDEQGNVRLADEASVETFEYIKKMYDEGWIPADSISSTDQMPLFLEGRILAVQASGDRLSALNAQNKNFVIGPPLENKAKATYGTTGLFVVAKTSKHPESAIEFVKHITNTENAKTFNALSSFLPTRKSATGIYDDNPLMKQFVEYTQYTLPGVMHPTGRSIMPLIQAEMQAVMEGKKTPKEAAQAAKTAVENEMNKE